MTRKEAIDGLKRLVGEDCTETQWDYMDEIKFAIMIMTKEEPCEDCQEFSCYGCKYAVE